MRAIFTVLVTSGSPAIDVAALHEYVAGHVRDGCGYSCLGQVPTPLAVCAVRIDSSTAIIAALKAGTHRDSTGNLIDWLWVEDVA